MKAKRFLYFIIFLLSGVFAYANSDEIIYVLPDSLENMVVEQINTYNEKDNILIYLFHRENKICLLISTYKGNDSSPLYYYASRTNRFLLADENVYPILFDYDFKYSTMTPLDKIGKSGEREGSIARVAVIFDIDDFIQLSKN